MDARVKPRVKPAHDVERWFNMTGIRSSSAFPNFESYALSFQGEADGGGREPGIQELTPEVYWIPGSPSLCFGAPK